LVGQSVGQCDEREGKRRGVITFAFSHTDQIEIVRGGKRAEETLHSC